MIWSLEFALQLQEIAEMNINGEDGFMSPSDPLLQARKTTTDDDNDMLFSGSQSNGTGTSTAESGARSGNSFGSHQTVVFSEIMNPNGQSSSHHRYIDRQASRDYQVCTAMLLIAGNETSNVEEDLSEPEEHEVEEGSVPGKAFNSAELHSYISPKPNRINGKKTFLGLEAINPSIGLGCVGMASNTDRFMTYKMIGTWLRSLRGFYKCYDCFDLSRRGWEVPNNESLLAEFTIDEFVLFDWDRVLQPKGILWVDRFFCKKEDMNLYLNEFTRLGYQKLQWRVVPKTDKDGDEMFFSAVLEKPTRH
ncbi:hypothetical protein TEA_015373 [Camellia sinensis var. sinensis]|uniref:Methyltransferase n=1 Tax=Camellia sinensis var. sinensis TaxID=542762 RepID=A0A4S4D255_CAMSN|nr:hypothetical protein TEA_015373 [Camellia sinensis var. sinensis]